MVWVFLIILAGASLFYELFLVLFPSLFSVRMAEEAKTQEFLTQLLKIGPKFSGNYSQTRGFIKQIEAITAVWGANADNVLTIMPVLLSDDALSWWGTAGPFTAWDDFCTALKDRFLPATSFTAARTALESLKQGSMSMDEYHDAFMKKSVETREVLGGDAPSTKVLVSIFVNNMRDGMRRLFFTKGELPATMTEVMELARGWEINLGPMESEVMVLSSPAPVSRPQPSTQGSGQTNQSGQQRESTRRNGPGFACYICGQKDHGASLCEWGPTVRRQVAKWKEERKDPGSVGVISLCPMSVERPTLELSIAGVGTKVLVDTGCEVSLLDASLVPDHVEVSPSSRLLSSASGDRIGVLGSCSLPVKCEGEDLEWEVLIVDEKSLGFPGIIGMNAIIKWGLNLEVDEEGLKVSPKIDQVHVVEATEWETMEYWEERFPGLCDFQAGSVTCFTAHIPTYCWDEEKIMCPMNRLSPQAMERHKQVAADLMEKGILIEAPSSSPFRTRLVPVVKGHAADGSEILRGTGDFRNLNLVTVKDSLPLHSAQSLVGEVRGADRLSKLDLIQAFYQLPLAEEDQFKTNVVVDGRELWFACCPQGGKNSTASLQRALGEGLEGVEGVECYVDDVILHSRGGDEAHFQLLERVFSRLHQCGFSVSKEKSLLNQMDLEVLGLKISGQGVTYGDQHNDTIRSLEEVKGLSQLRSHLSFLSFLLPYIPNLAIQMEPFAPLRKKGADFDMLWTQELESLWGELLSNLSNEKLVSHYDPNGGDLLMEVDASLSAFGGLIFQDGKVIYLTSGSFGDKSLATNPQRELWAIYLVALKSLHLLEGHRVRVATDCQSLLALNQGVFSDPLMAKLHFKIQQLDLELEVIHSPANEHLLADSLSRIAVLNLESLSDLQDSDEMIGLIKRVLKGEEETDERRIRDLAAICHLEDDVLMREKRFVFPTNLAWDALEELHLTHGHPGANRLKMLVKRENWWTPHLSPTVARFLSSCIRCQKSSPPRRSDSQGSRVVEVPSVPNDIIHIDLFEVDKSNAGVVIVDAFSTLIYAAGLVDSSTETVMSHVQMWVAMRGKPRLIVSDNGPCFRAAFSDGLASMGIQHQLSTPYRPQGNGVAENGVKIVKAALKGWRVDHPSGSWRMALPELILQHNNCPLSSSPLTPVELAGGDLSEDELQERRGTLEQSRRRHFQPSYVSELEVGDQVVMRSYTPITALDPFYPFDGVVVGVSASSVLVQSGTKRFKRPRSWVRKVTNPRDQVDGDDDDNYHGQEEVKEVEEEVKEEEEEEEVKEEIKAEEGPGPMVRRSDRTVAPPDFYSP